MDDKTYNGWSNYETWLVALWFNNDEDTYRCTLVSARQVCESTSTVRKGGNYSAADVRLSDILRDHVENGREDQPGMYHDLLSRALNAVDWCEIARGVIDSLPAV